VAGRIVACHWARQACQRQLDDLERARTGWKYRFDRKKANRICQFVEGLPHIKGEWAKRGEHITLQAWQCFIYTTVFGWVSRETGLRRFRIAYNEVARKNSKSTMSAPVGIFMTCADQEAGAEVYSAATTRDQAKVVWDVAQQMVQRETGLQQAFCIDSTAHSIFQSASASRFQALSAEGNSLDGLNVHCAIVDELHAHRNRKVYDVLETARGARQQPLLWLITTAGSDRSGICYEQRTYVTKILDGVAEDDSYFGIIYTLDPDDDWADESNWVKANPNLNVSVYAEELRPLALKARKMPSALNNFLTKHLSVWVNADSPLFNMKAWELCKDESLTIEDFRGEPVWVGLDLAPRHDFVALAQLFRREDRYYAFLKHYLSEMEIEDSGNSSYAGWAAEGWITSNPGNSTDYDQIEEELLRISSDFDLREVLYDPAGAKQILDHMQAAGLPMVEMRPIVTNFSEPTKLLDALIADGKITHDGNPVLAWELSNVVGHYDRKDNVYPVKPKERPENKIDGVIALIMALARAMVQAAPKQPSYQVMFF
jgi:phage terminase large subunit-like protein